MNSFKQSRRQHREAQIKAKKLVERYIIGWVIVRRPLLYGYLNPQPVYEPLPLIVIRDIKTILWISKNMLPFKYVILYDSFLYNFVYSKPLNLLLC